MPLGVLVRAENLLGGSHEHTLAFDIMPLNVLVSAENLLGGSHEDTSL